jgi:surfactin synthase thioesterase subunit
MMKVQVFFIPYAGASSLAYYGWKKHFSEEYELYFVELAGRGTKGNMDFYRDIDEAASDIAKTIEQQINGENYILFGHSMGALLAYESYYKISELHLPPPKHIFFSGKDAPHLKHSSEKVYLYDDEKFLYIVSLYGGLPVEFFQRNIREIFLPILRSDFKLLCDYDHKSKDEKIMSNVSVLFSDNDFSVKPSQMDQWKHHVGKECKFYQFPGGHFYINNSCQEIAQLIMDTKDTKTLWPDYISNL